MKRKPCRLPDSQQPDSAVTPLNDDLFLVAGTDVLNRLNAPAHDSGKHGIAVNAVIIIIDADGGVCGINPAPLRFGNREELRHLLAVAHDGTAGHTVSLLHPVQKEIGVFLIPRNGFVDEDGLSRFDKRFRLFHVPVPVRRMDNDAIDKRKHLLKTFHRIWD